MTLRSSRPASVRASGPVYFSRRTITPGLHWPPSAVKHRVLPCQSAIALSSKLLCIDIYAVDSGGAVTPV